MKRKKIKLISITLKMQVVLQYVSNKIELEIRQIFCLGFILLDTYCSIKSNQNWRNLWEHWSLQ